MPPGVAVFPANELYVLQGAVQPGKGSTMRDGLLPTLVYETLVVATSTIGAATRASSV